MSLLLYLWIAFALNYIDRQIVYSMLPALTRDLGMTPLALSWIGTLFLWSYTPALPIAGLLADRYRRDRLIVSSLLLWSAATLGCGLAQSSTSFLIWRVVMGVTEALYYPTALALIASHFPEAQRSRALGLHQSAQFAGGILGGWYGGWAADNTGWRTAFLAAGAVGILFTPLLMRGLPASIPPPSSNTSPIRPWALFQSIPFLLLAATFSSYCSIQWIFFAWFPTHLQDRFQMSMTSSGLASTFSVQCAIILGIFIGGALADRFRLRLQITALGAMLCAPFAYLAFATNTLPLALASAAGFGLFAGGLSANAFAGAYDLVDPRLRGLAAGVLNMCGGFVSGAMILTAGLLRNSIGFSPLLLGAGLVTILFASTLMFRRRIQYAM
jgi:MFS transporter, Spinster family, sphingosine-1-phosphate transporter